MFRDRSKFEFGTIPITTGCNREIINLVNTFTDEFSEEGGMGSCGALEFKLGWQGLITHTVEYPFI